MAEKRKVIRQTTKVVIIHFLAELGKVSHLPARMASKGNIPTSLSQKCLLLHAG
jgi:hypothetical protein